jgi:hypothetical protein
MVVVYEIRRRFALSLTARCYSWPPTEMLLRRQEIYEYTPWELSLPSSISTRWEFSMSTLGH